MGKMKEGKEEEKQRKYDTLLGMECGGRLEGDKEGSEVI